jgi:hypothetical protein
MYVTTIFLAFPHVLWEEMRIRRILAPLGPPWGPKHLAAAQGSAVVNLQGGAGKMGILWGKTWDL